MTVGQTIKTWSVMETIISVVGLITVLLVSLVCTSSGEVGARGGHRHHQHQGGRVRHRGRRPGTSHSAGYPLDEPHPGHAEQDPALILDAVLESVRDGGGRAGRAGGRAVVQLGDAHADRRWTADAQPAHPVADLGRLPVQRAGRAAAGGRRRAGPAPADRHAGAPDGAAAQAGLVPRAAAGAVRASRATWAGHQGLRAAPDVRRAGHRPLGRLGHRPDGHPPLDWDAEALRHRRHHRGAAARAACPPPPCCPGSPPRPPTATGLPADTPVVLGAGDGPLANLGLGAVDPGVAACSIGTSGALRVMVEQAGGRPARRRVLLRADRGPLGGRRRDQQRRHRAGLGRRRAGPGARRRTPRRSCSRWPARAPAGSGGLIMLPYLLSERAPHWSALPRGAYVGLTREHRREHLVRAALEGVCQQLALVLHSMRAAGNEVREIRATGGFARSPLWRQMLADALGMHGALPGRARGVQLRRGAARHAGARADRRPSTWPPTWSGSRTRYAPTRPPRPRTRRCCRSSPSCTTR